MAALADGAILSVNDGVSGGANPFKTVSVTVAPVEYNLVEANYLNMGTDISQFERSLLAPADLVAVLQYDPAYIDRLDALLWDEASWVVTRPSSSGSETFTMPGKLFRYTPSSWEVGGIRTIEIAVRQTGAITSAE